MYCLESSTHLGSNDGNLPHGEEEVTLGPVLLVDLGQQVQKVLLAKGLAIELPILAVYTMNEDVREMTMEFWYWPVPSCQSLHIDSRSEVCGSSLLLKPFSCRNTSLCKHNDGIISNCA
jgi:hypothetical protein